MMVQVLYLLPQLTRQVPGPPAFMMTQLGKQTQRRSKITSGGGGGPQSPVSPPPDTVGNMVLVFFIGGVTHAEISALRHLTNREDSEF